MKANVWFELNFKQKQRFGQHSLWQTPGLAGSLPTQGLALQLLGRPLTAMGWHLVCIANGLFLETIGNGG